MDALPAQKKSRAMDWLAGRPARPGRMLGLKTVIISPRQKQPDMLRHCRSQIVFMEQINCAPKVWRHLRALVLTACCCKCLSATAGIIEISQASNGAAPSPTTPAQWTTNVLSAANHHALEGYSVPFRVVLSDISTGHHNINIEWDIVQSNRHAFDYLTHFDRQLPHNIFSSHATAETLNPLVGLGGSFTGPTTVTLPPPSSTNSPVAGQPASSFNSLTPGEKLFTIWNGNITNLAYLNEGDLTTNSAARISVDFEASDTNVVLAWGAHIAAKADWGDGATVSGYSGQLHNMRIVSFDGEPALTQLAMQSDAVYEPLSVSITGPAAACDSTTNTYAVLSASTISNATYSWSIVADTSGAAILGPTNQPSVQVLAGSNGVFTLSVSVTTTSVFGTAQSSTTVLAPTTASALTSQTVCPGSEVAFATTAGGTGPCSFAWRKDGVAIPDATNSALTITGVGLAGSGAYCVEVAGSCGGITNCASLTVTPPASIACPTNITVQCHGDVPAPDTNAVTVSGAVSVLHLGDSAATNGCEIVITRAYAAVNSCNATSICNQIITVRDTTPPVLVCAGNRNVECATAWAFDPPTATDNCAFTNVAINILSTVTNPLCGTTFSATRTWVATDFCGNTNTCSQTLTVLDTTPPVILCSSNILVECTGGLGRAVTFTISASDACNTNVVVTSTPLSGSFFSLGTNTVHSVAVDACGNSNTCSFTVTVVDTTPPTISCPSNIIAAEIPFDSGSAVVTYAAPVVSDICDPNLTLVTSPPSGFHFPTGTNTVNALVTDIAGNSNTCSFTVRVIPYRLYVTNTDDSGPGTLRQALLDANDAPGENLVLFNLPGAGVHTIALDSALPEITSPVIVNGWSQPGFTGPPLIEITGATITNRVDGLNLTAGRSLVRGLILNGFATAIRISSNGTNAVQGCFIGTDATGLNISSNSADGIYISCGPNLIGGTTNNSSNVIGGNGGSGIHFDGPTATNNLVRGNFIGTGADGASPLGNGLDGVRLENGATRNSIGTVVGLGPNSIAFNGRNGVTLEATAGTRNAIYGNPMHHNGALGIDLGNDGVTPNDADDADGGPNQLQNFPDLTDARYADGGLVIDGTLASQPNTNFRLDFYLNNTANPSLHGEGQFYLGSGSVATAGNGTGDFTVGFAVSAVYTQYVSATVTDPLGNTSEFSPVRRVRTPPVLETQPIGTNLNAGGNVTLCALASGTAPIYYQWRLNGVNLPGETNACLTISNAQTLNNGNYRVVVFNALGGSLSTPARVQVAVPGAIAAGDNFVDRVALSGVTGQTAGGNHNATREPGEPDHAHKPGGKSVWYTWTPTITGIATVGTSGSDFDTLLGVYRGTNVSNLIEVGSDDDRGGFFASGLRFNAIKNKSYHFAIDGYGGDEGDFVFGWTLEDSPHLLPVIGTDPQSQTVAPGDSVTFTIVAFRECGNGQNNCPDPTHYPGEQLPGLSVQWFFQGVPIPGAINYSLTISNVQPADVGRYTARVTAHYESDKILRTVESNPADLQINVTGEGSERIHAWDKLLDALLGPPWIIGGNSGGATAARYETTAAGTVVRGFTGTQIFNTAGSTTSPAEDAICGVLGGASEWITFVAIESGDLFLNTDGSSYDTVMAVFLRNPTNATMLTQVGCNNNGGLDGQDSSLVVPVTVGQTNAILIDGVNGASGTLKLNYSLVPKITLTLLGLNPQNQFGVRVTGRTNLNFSIQRSTNLTTWTTILTTNAPAGLFDYYEPVTGSGSRAYRAKALP